jgi:hypothetical protein
MQAEIEGLRRTEFNFAERLTVRSISLEKRNSVRLSLDKPLNLRGFLKGLPRLQGSQFWRVVRRLTWPPLSETRMPVSERPVHVEQARQPPSERYFTASFNSFRARTFTF